jgi:NAD(P)-dependent dehydrogenase (short-subunit alcohol dehydrogenase family)
MPSHKDQVAVITGAAGGLGLALARQCASRGMRLLLADVDPAALAGAAATFGPETTVLTQLADVSRPEPVEALADTAFGRLGRVDLLFNNAGVGVAKPVLETALNDWRWVLGVNLYGVIHGIAAFLPRMLEQPFPSRVVNTASAAGHTSPPGSAAYNVSKHGVVTLSETLRAELAMQRARVGVTVLCPAFFPTGIIASERVRPPELAAPPATSAAAQAAQAGLEKAVRSGRLSADDVAAQAVAAALAGEFYVFTHKRIRLAIEERMKGILDACPFPPRT